MDCVTFVLILAVAVQVVEYLMSASLAYEVDDQLTLSLFDSDIDVVGDIQVALNNVVLHDYEVTLNLLTSNRELK